MNEDYEAEMTGEPPTALGVFESAETGLLSYAVVCNAEALLVDVSDDVASEVSRWCSERGATPVYSVFTSGTSSRSGSDSDLHRLAAELGLEMTPDVERDETCVALAVRAEIRPVAPWACEHSEPRLVLCVGGQLVELDSTPPSGGASVCLVIEEAARFPPVLCVQDLLLVVGGMRARVVPLDGRAQRLAVSAGPYVFTGGQGARSSVGLEKLRDRYPTAIEHGRRRARSRRDTADLWQPEVGIDSVETEMLTTGEGGEWGTSSVIPFERRSYQG